MTSAILEIRKVDLPLGGWSAFMRVIFDEDRIVGHFVEGQTHPSFGFKLTSEELEGVFEMACCLPECKHPDGIGHALTVCIVQFEGTAAKRTLYCVPFEEQKKPEYGKLVAWVERMFARGQENRDIYLGPGPRG